MSAHIFWPPLAVLSMGVMMIIFILLKYGDKLLKARTVPKYQNYEIENQSSENTTFDVDERSMQMMQYEQDPDEEDEDPDHTQMEIIPIREKYEYAV